MPHPGRSAAALLAAVSLLAVGCGSNGSGAADTTPVGPADLAAGKAVYLGVSGCGGCHTLADAGSKSTIASDLDERRPTEALVREVVANGKDAMPPYARQLTPQEIVDVAAYVAAVAGK